MSNKSAEVIKVIKYIEEKEKNLSKYSDKLRRAINLIFAQLSNNYKCKICGGTSYNSLTRECRGGGHIWTHGVNVSIDIEGDEAFRIIEDEGLTRKFYLAIREHNFGILEKQDDEETFYDAEQANVATLKSLVKSGQIATFIKKVAETLREREEEYREVSEIAEKLAKAG